jgi:hypothetical protein
MRASQLAAQETTASLAPEIRADALVARSPAYQLAAGAALPTGDYLWLGADLGAGIVAGPRLEPSARVDVTGRLWFDPNSETHWAPYLVGGMSYRADGGARGALYLLIAVGVHAPPSHGLVPALEVGLGGGVRVGIVIRRARPGR